MVPPPTSILSTSPGKYQVLWRVEGFDSVLQEQLLKLLAIAFGGDPALHRLQPCPPCPRFPESKVRSSAPGHRRISR
ncbi:MAG: DNA-primase RepB domain-containing protein [Edaphobacter sp.]